MGVLIYTWFIAARGPTLAQLLIRRVEDQANALTNSDSIPYENLRDGALVESALAGEYREHRP
jgi:hypothetical protein